MFKKKVSPGLFGFLTFRDKICCHVSLIDRARHEFNFLEIRTVVCGP